MAGRVAPRNLRADPGRGRHSVPRPAEPGAVDGRSYYWTLTRLVHELGGDRPRSALTREAVTVAVTAAKNADARINSRAKRPAAWPLPLSRWTTPARVREKAIERGGRSSGRLSGTATTTPIVGVSPVAATPRPASLP
jgi:hypothetical protein